MRSSTRPPASDPRMRTGLLRRRPCDRALRCDVRDGALEQRRVDVHPRQRLRHVDLDAAAVVAQARERLRHDLVQPDHVLRPGRAAASGSCCMSSRLPTSELSRSVSSSIVARNSATSSAFHVTSSWRRLLTAALTDASGVRRSWETAARIAARRSLTSTSSAASSASRFRRPGADRDRELRDERRRGPGGSRPAAGGPRITSDGTVAEVERLRSAGRARTGRRPRRRPRRPSHRRRSRRTETASSRTWCARCCTRARAAGRRRRRAGRPDAPAPRPPPGPAAPRLAARAARLTKTAHHAPPRTNTKIANRCSGSAIVHVWIGGTK